MTDFLQLTSHLGASMGNLTSGPVITQYTRPLLEFLITGVHVIVETRSGACDAPPASTLLERVLVGSVGAGLGYSLSAGAGVVRSPWLRGSTCTDGLHWSVGGQARA